MEMARADRAQNLLQRILLVEKCVQKVSIVFLKATL